MEERQIGKATTIGKYLLRKLQEYGIQHVFGIPGDYVLWLFHLPEQSPIQHIGMTREDAAGIETRFSDRLETPST